MHLADEMLDHLLRHLEIGDHAVPQRPDGGDVARGAAEHQLGLLAHRQHLLAAADIGDGDHRRLVQHDAPTLHVDQRVRGAEVDGHVGREEAEQAREHAKETFRADGLTPGAGSRPPWRRCGAPARAHGCEGLGCGRGLPVCRPPLKPSVRIFTKARIAHSGVPNRWRNRTVTSGVTEAREETTRCGNSILACWALPPSASAACGYSTGDRAVSGGLLGAGAGAGVGALTGSAGTGALIGGAAGAAGGALTSAGREPGPARLALSGDCRGGAAD